MADLAALSESVINGNAGKVEELTKQALKEGLGALEILNNALVKAMDVVGEKYKSY
jgi:methanogenic corrinoid protein MtbC1